MTTENFSTQTNPPAEVPMIWTSKGNLPVDILEYSVLWEEPPAEPGQLPIYTKFSEIYKLNGEIVKQSAHVLSRQGPTMQSAVGSFM